MKVKTKKASTASGSLICIFSGGNGEGENEKGIDCKSGKVLVEVSPDFYRPTDVVNLLGDPSKAKRELGWNPQKTSFEQLVKIMVDADMAKVAVERASQQVRTNLAEYLEKGIVK